MDEKSKIDSINVNSKFISGIPEWATPESVVARRTVTVKDKDGDGQTEYEYVVIDNDFATAKGAPAQFALVDAEKKILGIGSNYPEQYADLAMRHEITERILNQDRREELEICVECLKKELDIVKQDAAINYADYINVRLDFFEGMVGLYEKDPDSTEPLHKITLEQMKLSRDYLKREKENLEKSK